jgi:hypothetical protein
MAISSSPWMLWMDSMPVTHTTRLRMLVGVSTHVLTTTTDPGQAFVLARAGVQTIQVIRSPPRVFQQSFTR